MAKKMRYRCYDSFYAFMMSGITKKTYERMKLNYRVVCDESVNGLPRVVWEEIVADPGNGVVTEFSQNFNLIFCTFHLQQAF